MDSKAILCIFGVLALVGSFLFLFKLVSSHDARLEEEAKRKAEIEEQDRQEQRERNEAARKASAERAEANRGKAEEQAAIRRADQAKRLAAQVEAQRKRADEMKRQQASDAIQQKDALAKEEATLDAEQTSAVWKAQAERERARKEQREESLENARSRAKELVLQLKDAREELAVRQKDQPYEEELQKLDSLIRSYEHTLAGIRDKLNTADGGSRSSKRRTSEEGTSDDPARAGLLVTRDHTEKLLQEAMTKRNGLMGRAGAGDVVRALRGRIADTERSIDALKRAYPQLSGWVDSLLPLAPAKASSATASSGKLPVTIYVMADGKEIRAINVVTMGDQLAIKDEKGAIQTIEKKDVREIKKESEEEQR